VTIPGDGSSAAACAPTATDCVYIIGVWCADDYTAPVACEYVMTPATAATGLARLTDGLPVRASLAPAAYRWFLFESPRGTRNITFEASPESGSVALYVTAGYVPGVSPSSALPRGEVAGSYAWASGPDAPLVSVAQTPALSTPGRNGSGSAATVLFTVGVRATSTTGLASFTLAAASSSTPLSLLPGQASTGHVLVTGGVSLFAVDITDPSRDVEVSVNLMYGRAYLALGSRGEVPACTYAAGAAAPVCTGAVWAAGTGREGVAAIRVSARRVCNNTARVPGVACVPELDYAVGPLYIAVVGMDDAMFTISALAASGFVRLVDGQPLTVVQAAGDDAQVLLYSILPDAGQADIRITFAPTAASSALTYYINSCVEGVCTDAVERPGAGAAAATGAVPAGSRTDVIIGKNDAAYCRAAATGTAVCSYFISVAPTIADCTSRGVAAADCTAIVTVTPTLMSATATVVLDYNTLKDKLTSFSAEAAAGRTSRYYLYVQSDADLTADLYMRLDACDRVGGYVAGYVCENPAFYSSAGNAASGLGVTGAPLCADPRAPGPGNAEVVLSTTPGTEGGDGRARASLVGTPTSLVHAAVTIPAAASGAAAGRARFGPTMYELSVTLGRGLYMKQPTRDAVGALVVTIVPSESTTATLTWTPPVMLNDSSVTAWNYTTYGAGLRYIVYLAPRSFAISAARITNTSVGAAGIMATTPCGLERWASLVAPNVTSVYTTTATSFTLTGLVPGYPYEVNVVAVCDAACLRANAVRLGYGVPTTGLSSQRLPYAVVSVQTIPATEEPLAEEDHANSTTGTLAPLGIVVVILLAAVVGYVMHKMHKAAAVRDAAKAAATGTSSRPTISGAAGGSGSSEDGLSAPRTPSIRRALAASAAHPTVDDDLITTTMAARMSSAGATAARTPSTRPGVSL